MPNHLHRFHILFVFILLLTAATAVPADEWPAYRHDARRSAVTQEKLSLPLQVAWRYTSAQPPSPAWPAPVKTLNRLDFDYAPALVVAGGRVFFGSSADDTLRALDLKTGTLLWQFTAGGPIRFAPQVEGKRVYVAADDGRIYALEADTGRVAWSFRGGLDDSLMIGNGRMISRWPARSGVLLFAGVLHVVFGMWPSDGIFVYALNPADGKVRWCNDTSGMLFMSSAHGGEFTLSGVAPQGSLLADAGVLLAPAGRVIPAAYDLKTGALLYHDIGGHNCRGGSSLVIDRGRFYTYSKNFYSPLAIEVIDLATGKSAGSERNVPQISTFGKGARKAYSEYEDARVSFLVAGGKLVARRAWGLALAGDVLFVGNDGEVAAEPLGGGPATWSAKVAGRPREFAVADGRLLVATSTGEITCFAAQANLPAGSPVAHAFKPAVTPEPGPNDTGKAIIKAATATGLAHGYALVIGDTDGRMARALAAGTQLHVVSLLPDAAAVAAARGWLLTETTWYGSRIHVLQAPADGRLPFAPYFASAIVVRGTPAGLKAEELFRVLRPCGGVVVLDGTGDALAASLRTLGVAPVAAPGAGLVVLTRGRLEGSRDWDSPPGQGEKLTRWPLQMIWFGEPGAAKVMDRKEGADVLAANGLFFIKGENRDQGLLTAVDGYNGVEWWSVPIPGQKSFRIAYADASNVYVAASGSLLCLDARTGATKQSLGPNDHLPEAATKRHDARLGADVAKLPRLHPLTGLKTPRNWGGFFGCGGMALTHCLTTSRSGTLGIYDFLDDSGIRNIGGVSPSCGSSLEGACGVLISVEGRGGCDCSYNFQTSFVLAPTSRRSQEDWALFYERPADLPVRAAAINLGAPGDRRDDQGTLWLGFPRSSDVGHGGSPRAPGQTVMNDRRIEQPMTVMMPVPLTVDVAEGGGPFRINADRTPVAGTDRPWLYASCYRGIRKATLHLLPTKPLATAAAAGPIKVDGMLDEATWRGEPQATLAMTETEMRLRHDETKLYIGLSRPGNVNRHGKTKDEDVGELGPDWAPKAEKAGADKKKAKSEAAKKPGKAETAKKEDKPEKPIAVQPPPKRDAAALWSDASYEVFLSDASGAILHLGVAAPDAQYDALTPPGKTEENARWNGTWSSAVTQPDGGLLAEIAIPLKLLEEAKLDRRTLSLNVLSNVRHNWGDSLINLGMDDRRHCGGFVPVGFGAPPALAPRMFTVSLHFAELADLQPGQRVFDVLLQGQPVLKNFDVVKEAGGQRKALLKEFKGVRAGESLTVEFVPSARGPASTNGPILNALEIREERHTPPATIAMPTGQEADNRGNVVRSGGTR